MANLESVPSVEQEMADMVDEALRDHCLEGIRGPIQEMFKALDIVITCEDGDQEMTDSWLEQAALHYSAAVAAYRDIKAEAEE